MSAEPLGRAEEKLLVALRRRREREERGLFLAEGVRVAEELLAANGVLRLVVTAPSLEDTERGRALRARVAASGARTASDATLARLAATDSPQGILLVAEIPRRDPAALHLPQRATVIVLDGVQDPGNFGTLVRAADAFSVAAALALPGTVDAWNPKAVRAAAGSSFRVPILTLSVDAARDWLRREGFAVVVADAAGAPVRGWPRPDRVALVVGNEGAGVTDPWRAEADATLAVQTPGPVESLNVAVAAGIMLHELTTGTRAGNA